MTSAKQFVARLKVFYKKEGRSHLPWRHTRDPYKILVSEVMLQQTQVERVIPKYRAFIRAFPTPRALSKAPFSNVLAYWQGLGYNRRAKFLQQAAKIISANSFPKTAEEIEQLPGVGHYTARAVATFVFNAPEVFIETNIRTVFTHVYFPKKKIVSDVELRPYIAAALKESKMPPRDFYAALMDYGAYLKKSGIKLNSRSSHYVKQSRFEGSRRQLRGAILRELLHSSQTALQLSKKIARPQKAIARELKRLEQEELLNRTGKTFSITTY